MSTEERRRAIVEVIEREGAAAITALSVAFDVSEMTVRRDLDALQAAGQVQRTHGGAVLATSSGIEPRYAAKQRVNAELKSRIARYAAAHLVGDGDVIAMEGGTTVTAMARYLGGNRGLTVATNGLYTTNDLGALLPDAIVICSGGILRDVAYTFVGPGAVDFFRGFHSRKAFVSATGFTLAQGFTDPNLLEAEVRRAMVSSADQIIALVDSSKFGTVSTTRVAAAADVDILVTDTRTEFTDELTSIGVDVRVAP